MKKKRIKKFKYQMTKVGIELDKLESLSRILTECIINNENIKRWDSENLSYVVAAKIFNTRKLFNQIEMLMNDIEIFQP